MTRPWYPFYWSDYSGKTVHLSLCQHGAYFMLLRFIYTTERPIPHKQCYSICKAMLKHERAAVDHVLTEFFRREGDFWTNDRAFEVIAEAKDRYERRAKAGQLGGLQKASNATAMLEQNPSNALVTTTTPTTHKEEVSKNRSHVGNGNGTPTIADPHERIARFQQKLAQALGPAGWEIVIAACTRADPNHSQALETCKSTARSLNKGWPRQWPIM